MTDDEQIGCSDSYCDIAGKATGMHTNGGCKCLHGMDPDKRRVVRGELKRLRECASEATKAKAERDEALCQLLAPTRPRYSTANFALDSARIPGATNLEAELIEAKRMVCITVVTGDPRGQHEGQHALDCSSVETVAAEMGWPDLYPDEPDATEGPS